MVLRTRSQLRTLASSSSMASPASRNLTIERLWRDPDLGSKQLPAALGGDLATVPSKPGVEPVGDFCDRQNFCAETSALHFAREMRLKGNRESAVSREARGLNRPGFVGGSNS